MQVLVTNQVVEEPSAAADWSSNALTGGRNSLNYSFQGEDKVACSDKSSWQSAQPIEGIADVQAVADGRKYRPAMGTMWHHCISTRITLSQFGAGGGDVHARTLSKNIIMSGTCSDEFGLRDQRNVLSDRSACISSISNVTCADNSVRALGKRQRNPDLDRVTFSDNDEESEVYAYDPVRLTEQIQKLKVTKSPLCGPFSMSYCITQRGLEFVDVGV